MRQINRLKTKTTPPPNATLDWLVALSSLWLICGLYLDGWAHNHLDSAFETFLTPWHAVLYSGSMACGAVLAAAAIRYRRMGYTWRRLLPAGYTASLVGAILFGIAGGCDFAWHALFGVEKDLESLLSPPHLFLVTSGVLMVSGPLRAAWQRTRPPQDWKQWLPVALSLALSISTLTFITQFAHFVRDAPTGAAPADPVVAALLQCQNVAGYMLQGGLLLGAMLLLLRRWGTRLPLGMFTLLLGCNFLGMSFMTNEQRLVVPAIATGLLADVLAKLLRPSAANVRSLRLFSAIVPAALMSALFATWHATDTIWWSIHMWSGSILMTAAVGLFLSYLVTPPWTEKR